MVRISELNFHAVEGSVEFVELVNLEVVDTQMQGWCIEGIDFCFEELNLHRVEILCATNNHKSNRIPQKLGFQLEGVFKKYELLPTGYVDVNYYAMLMENWVK